MKKLLLLLIALLFTAGFTSTKAVDNNYFDVKFINVVNDYEQGTSTWTYTITGHGTGNAPALSHWVLALCKDHHVISSNYDYEVNTDPKLDIYGIKWDVTVPKSGETVTFSFTLDAIYSEESVQFGIKAGTRLMYGMVTGPGCDELTLQKPIYPLVECVQKNDDGTYTAYFGYESENITDITIPVGSDNFLSPGAENQGQSTVFHTGRTDYYPNAAFSVVFDGNPLIWTLKGPDGVTRTAIASRDNSSCVETPELGSLGDKVWYDDNHNGVQDDNENGVSGVTIKLYNCSHALLDETITDEHGNYLFDELPAGSYYVKFILPDGYKFSPKDEGGNDAIDSDANTTTGITICTTLDEGENDLTWDAGIYIPETTKNTDLSLIKVVDNDKPKNGDQITFTITVTNNGPDNATGVQVTDLLRDGLTFVSVDGDYNPLTGIWNVGNLSSGESKSLKITVKVETEDIHTSTFDLGVAKDFNVFIFDDVFMPSSDTQGRMAVGGDASLSGYSVGDQLPNSNGAVDVLVVGGHLQYTSGAVYGGNVVYGTSTNLPIYGVSITGGTLKQGTPVDFAAAQTYLTNLSTDLAAYTVNGNTVMEWGGLTLTGTDPLLNVFSVNGSDLSNANDFQINVPNGSVVLVNIGGTDVEWSGGLKVNGTDIRNVLYNFYEAQNLTIQGIDVTGSILAPLAHVHFISGVQNGQMIAKSLEGQGQVNYVMFMGNIPEETTLTNIAEVIKMDQTDPDSEPANGDPGEDDYSSVTIVVNGTEDNGGGDNGGDNGGSDGSGNWEQLSNSSITEMIWSLVENQNSLFAGTVGGKIYKSTNEGADWTRINEDMNVGWIWSIAIDNGYYYAATEQGIYRSENGTTWTLVGLSGKDVRALVAINNKVYAGTWGYGVFVSEDHGGNWTEMNNELSCLAVHALVMNSDGDLFAGTFGGGVFKYTNGKWNKLEVGYDHVWALGITSDNRIYAGTYGGGVYYSGNNGDTWTTLNGGLPTQFIYAVTVDGTNNVYLNTWAGGIYGLSSQTNEWFSTGMAGKDVTSIAASLSSPTLYLGTKSGMVFKSSKSLTNVGEEKVIPTEFALEQNYPNPFNPSTMIQFSIPAAGKYSVRVYNALGQMVETLADNNFEAGVHTIQFNAGRLSSGVYIYRLAGENVSISKKMVLAK